MKQFKFEMLTWQNINLDYTINSGQVFLWERHQKSWYGINGNQILVIKENPFKINFSSNNFDFFREGDDYENILQNISRDRVVKFAINSFKGLRLVRQDPFQCFISFIVSSNSNIQRIKLTLHKLCQKFGEKSNFEGKELFLFPTPGDLATASLKELRMCGLGYRANFVKEAAKAVSSGEFDFNFLRKTDYLTAKKLLKQVPGVGNKIADCVLLFSLDKLESFPIDRWMLKILQKYYSKKFLLSHNTLSEKNYDILHEELVNYFGPYAGYAQQFLFKMERDLNQKKWL